mmetsp:Transcript_42153/g.65986  ORF Transcript_42153/g.65986 Transcript_42153/m.65986 type:complete len:89 (+) Transcript_42153:248-514(+)
MGDPDYKALHARRPARADHNNWVHEQHQEWEQQQQASENHLIDKILGLDFQEKEIEIWRGDKVQCDPEKLGTCLAKCQTLECVKLHNV